MLEYYYSDNMYLLSTATLLLAVIIAFYCSNVLKDKNENCQNATDEGQENVQDEQNANKEGASASASDDDNDENAESVGDGGLLARLKSARLKTLEAQLTNDQLEEERRVEGEQLVAIFELLKKQESKLNVKELDEGELNAQMSLYR